MFRKLIYLTSFLPWLAWRSQVATGVLVLALVLTSAAKADLVGWWRFNEGSGDTANDSSGNDHHGTLCACQAGVGPLKNSVIPIIAL